MHAALLHREARAGNRATVLSMNSMVAFAAFGVAAPLLGLLAEQTSTQVAMVTAGAVSILGALLLPPRPPRREGPPQRGQQPSRSRVCTDRRHRQRSAHSSGLVVTAPTSL